MKRLRRAVKDAIIEAGAGLVAAGLDRAPRTPDELVELRPGRVLLVRTDRIGDLLATTPLVAAFRRLWPEADIVLLGGRRNRAVAGLMPYVRRAPVEFSRDLRSWARLTTWVPRQRFDVAVALRSEVFSGAWLCALSNAPVRVVVNATPALPAFNTVLVDSDQHHVRRCWRAAARLSVHWPEPRPIVELPQESARRAEAAWRALEIPEHEVAVGIAVPSRSGSRHRQRALPEAALVTLCRLVSAGGMRPVMFGFGPELVEARRIAAAVDGVRVAPPLDFATLGALLARLSVYVSGYSGPLHLADAVGTATVSVGSPVHVANFRPLGPGHRALAAVAVASVPPESIAAEVAELAGRSGTGVGKPSAGG